MKIWLPLFALTLLLAGCMSPQEDMARFVNPLAADEPVYFDVAKEFVRDAQASDLNGMLAMTSPLTHATQTDSVKKLYGEQVIPAFQGGSVEWQPGSRPDKDESGNVGLLFTGKFHGKPEFQFEVVVMRENGKLVIINIHRKHWDE